MRQLIGMEKGCPVTQMYLEYGQYPARFDIIRMQILYYHYILNEDPKSMIFKFLKIQEEYPVKGD